MVDINDIIADIVANAPVDRAGNWLLEAGNEFPEIFSALTEHLNDSPREVLMHLCKVYPAAFGLYLVPDVYGWIERLQKFFRERQHGKH